MRARRDEEADLMGSLAEVKQELLAVIDAFNVDEAPTPPARLDVLIEAIQPLSPISDPAHQLPSVVGSWSNLYARFGVGHSKGKSHREESTLSLQTFRVFPDVAIRVVEILQEIDLEPKTYHNVVLFETLAGAPGLVIIHGRYEPDDEDARRFRVVFYAAEVRPRDGLDEAGLRAALGLDPDALLRREFKPAKLYSDVVYLDEQIRINIGGMGGVYVLARRAEPAISLTSA
jgi:hypothetical protein